MKNINLELLKQTVDEKFGKVFKINVSEGDEKIGTIEITSDNINDLTPFNYDDILAKISDEFGVSNVDTVTLQTKNFHDVYNVSLNEIDRKVFEGDKTFEYKLVEKIGNNNDVKVETFSEAKAYSSLIYEKFNEAGEKRLVFEGYGSINAEGEVHYDTMHITLYQPTDKPLEINLSRTGVLTIEGKTYQVGREVTSEILSNNPQNVDDVKDIAYDIYKAEKVEKTITPEEKLLLEIFADRDDNVDDFESTEGDE